MSEVLLSGVDLRVDYGQTPALAGLSFAARAGESVAVVGPSGSGKSTLLRCLAGLQPPTAGTVAFKGRDLYELSDRVRSRIRLRRFGFVFQSAELVSELTLRENIALPVELNGSSRRASLAVADEWAERLGISDSSGRRPKQVSGGQRQRAAIARAVATRPSVVFADEPTGALDTRNRDLVLDLLVESSASLGSLLVLVTHDPVAAAKVGRVVRVVDGQLAQGGAQGEVLGGQGGMSSGREGAVVSTGPGQ
ncbi:ABC transporter ATP-binding protein [Intrasporangium mesophilum]